MCHRNEQLAGNRGKDGDTRGSNKRTHQADVHTNACRTLLLSLPALLTCSLIAVIGSVDLLINTADRSVPVDFRSSADVCASNSASDAAMRVCAVARREEMHEA